MIHPWLSFDLNEKGKIAIFYIFRLFKILFLHYASFTSLFYLNYLNANLAIFKQRIN